MARKTGLGRGLAALLSETEEETQMDNELAFAGNADNTYDKTENVFSKKNTANDVVLIPVDKLVPSHGQPRKNFDETELKELSDSIVKHGIIQPIIAAAAEDGTYIIIAGERRTRAARLAGLSEVPAIIRNYTDQKKLEISLIENIQRTDLNPIEEAAAYKNLMDFSGLSQDELAARVGKNRSTVANALRLLKLPAEIQKNIEQGKISPGHARALLSLNDNNAREKLYNEILRSELSVREAEKQAAVLNAESENKPGKKGQDKKNTGRPPEMDAMAEKFIRRLGTKVTLVGDLNKGHIHIDYYSMEDLERLYEILGG